MAQQCAVIVHGGAYAIPDSIAEQCQSGCREAAQRAYKALKEGKSALDAVEVAVRSLEDNPVFNAGHGSVLNQAGEVEMDAIIVDGASLNFGAVAGVKDISNPISLARMVMDKTSHVMLIGDGANQFAAEMGVPKVNSSELITQAVRDRREKYDKYNSVISAGFHSRTDDDPSQFQSKTDDSEPTGHDTVGAVAFDIHGNLAAATSTGGITLKRVGRVGDSPLIGAGASCDNSLGGVSCTGHGEAIAKVLLAQRALNQLERGVAADLDEAFEKCLGFMWERVGGRGGLIGIDRRGRTAKHFSTPRMSWASVDTDGVLKSGI